MSDEDQQPKPVPDWLRLQKKIFSRWVNQKVSKADLTCSDCVEEMRDGILLVKLMEVLSEKKFGGKLRMKATMDVHKLENATNALNFTLKECGVDMKRPPSSEDIIKGDEKNVLGLIWAIMLKFLKFGDDDDAEQLSAKDALLMWVKNKIVTYDLQVNKFGKEFHNGLVLCALLHKHRPKALDYASLSPDNAETNLQLALDCAEKYFGLEKYLEPSDIPKLDENSMVVFVSDFYFSIAEAFKLDLAARRIGKVIKLTEENDAAKLAYNDTVRRWDETRLRAEKVLEDRSIDNTMAGAKQRLEDFYQYKAKDKNAIISDQLDCEELFNNLAMVLTHNKRPPFVPPSGLALSDINAAVKHLEECEQERKVALHKELNRQIRLQQLAQNHAATKAALDEWGAKKTEYLEARETIDSVSGAQLQLRLLDAYVNENKGEKEGPLATLKNIGAELEEEKYEHIADVKARESAADEMFSKLDTLYAAKKPILDDALVREEYRADFHLKAKNHANKYEKIQAWAGEGEQSTRVATEKKDRTRKRSASTILKEVNSVNSVAEAQTQLSLLEAYVAEKASMLTNDIAQLNEAGQSILEAKHETEYSSWVFETPDDITSRKKALEIKWQLLDKLAEQKKKVLEDDLAREEFREGVNMLNEQHTSKQKEILTWAAEKIEYCKKKEEINNVADAKTALAMLDAFEADKLEQTKNDVATVKQLGADILDKIYETEYSKYTFETPEEIRDREAMVDAKWLELSDLSTEKRKVLDDDLAREEFKERVRMMNEGHKSKAAALQVWISGREAYLRTKEEIHSVADARTALSILSAFNLDKANKTEKAVAMLKDLGKEVKSQHFQGLTEWKFENPGEITEREHAIDQKWDELDTLAAEKKKILDDDLAREEYAAKTRLMNRNHINSHDKIQAWVSESEQYLQLKEEIDSVAQAKANISLLAAFKEEKEQSLQNAVAPLKELGASILARKYENLTTYVFENPAEVQEREKAVDDKYANLATLEGEKSKYLEEVLAREIEKERLRLEFAHQAREFTRWTASTMKVTEGTHFGFTIEEVEAFQAKLNSDDEAIRNNADTRTAECTKTFNDGVAIGIKENKYTSATLDSLAAEKTALDGALAKRREAYAAELELQRKNDALCKKFADAAEAFSSEIAATKQTITEATSELHIQLGEVARKEEAHTDGGKKLVELKAISDEMDAAGITNNRHTTLTYIDINVQWQQYLNFLHRKRQMLEREIERVKLRGISAEQFQEIEDNFKQFDKDGSGSIDKKELKACLYSLGEEKNKAEMNEIMEKHGQDGAINYEGFKDYMIEVLGVSDSQEDILASFKLINRGSEVAVEDKMDLVMSSHDWEYIKKTAPAKDGGYDYNSWTVDVFSR